MARRRLNKWPLILVCGVVAGGGGGALAWRKFRPKDPAKLAAYGDMYLRQGNLPFAAEQFAAASALRPTDTQLHLRLARIYYQMREQSPEDLQAAVAEWTRAAQLEPALKEPRAGLLEADMLRATSATQSKQQELRYLIPQEFTDARDAALELLKVDPGNVQARSDIPILTISLWLSNLTVPLTPAEQALPVSRQPSATQRVDGAVAELAGVLRDHPEDADLPYWIARAKIGRAVRLTQAAAAGTTTGDDATGEPAPDPKALMAEAVSVFDAPLAARPHDAQLYHRKYEIVSLLQLVDRSPDAVAEYQKQRRDALEHAQAEVTPADGANYSGYRLQWADFLALTDPAAAEAAYKALLGRPAATPPAGVAAGPDVERLFEDGNVRLDYAALLERDPTRRAEALRLLEAVPTAAPAGVNPLAGAAVQRLLSRGRLARAGLLTDLVEAEPAHAARADLAKRAAAELDGVSTGARPADEYALLKARGRLALVTSSFRDAIADLSAAAERQKSAGLPPDFDLLAWQADAYVGAQQPAEAVKLLERVVADPAGANLPQPHQLLAQLYLQNQDYEHGREQVAWLVERYPDDPGTLHLQIAALGSDPDPKRAAAVYDRLPEQTVPQRLDKVKWALRTGNRPDAERLYEDVLRDRPGEPAASLRLAQLYAADGAAGRANTVLQQAMDLHPEARGGLQLVKDGINGASEGALQDEAQGQIAAIKDPFARHLAEYRLAQSRGQPAQQVQALERARGDQPDNREVLVDLFGGYLATGAFDRAGALLPELSAADADHARGDLFRFRLAMARRDTPAALDVARRLTRGQPTVAAGWASLGAAQQAAGNLEAAAQAYGRALDVRGNDPDVVRRLVDCQVRQGKLADARVVLADARRRYPDAPAYRQLLVQTELAYGDPDDVLPVVDQALADHPDGVDDWQSAHLAYAAAARRHQVRGDAPGADRLADHDRSLLTDALKRFPDDWTLAAELGQAQARDGTDAGLAAAADTFRGLGQTPRWHGQALPDVLLGRLYLSADRPALAEPPLRRAVGAAPQLVEARTALADALVALHRPADGLDVLAPVKGQPAARAQYVQLMLRLGRGPAVEAELLADVTAHPDDATAANLLTDVYVARGEFDAARETADRALAADPKDAAALYVRGTTEIDRPHPDLPAGVRDLSAFRAAYPENVPGRVALARAMVATHDLEGAIRELEAAVDLPVDRPVDGKEARLMLARAYLGTLPPRTVDAARVVGQALALPQYAHDPDVLRVAAAVYLRQGDGDRAVAAVRDAMAHAADPQQLLRDYLDVLLKTRRYDLLLSDTDRYRDDAKVGPLVADDRGRARAATGDVPAAMAEFAKALDAAGATGTLPAAVAVAGDALQAVGPDRAVELLDPRARTSPLWRAVLANCDLAAGRPDRGMALVPGILDAAGTFAPADRVLVDRLAATLYMSVDPPDPARALPLFQDVIKQVPDDADALNNVACILSEQVTPPRPADALTYSTRAFEVERRAGQANPYVYDTQGWVLILNGRLDEGISLLHEVVDRADFPDVHYHLAEGYLRKRLPADARRELAAATTVYDAALAAHRAADRTLPRKVAAATAEADRLAREPPADKPEAGVGP